MRFLHLLLEFVFNHKFYGFPRIFRIITIGVSLFGCVLPIFPFSCFFLVVPIIYVILFCVSSFEKFISERRPGSFILSDNQMGTRFKSATVAPL